jgi:hypothetical protein
MDITSFSRKRKHNQHQLSDCRKCQQYWDDKWLSRDLQSNAKLKMYKDVRDYLNINSHLDMDLQKYSHGKKNRSSCIITSIISIIISVVIISISIIINTIS